MDKSTKMIIKQIINNENLYTLSHKTRNKLKEIQTEYEILKHLINTKAPKDKINKELMTLLEKENEHFETRNE